MKSTGIITLVLGLVLSGMSTIVSAQFPYARSAPGSSRYSANPYYPSDASNANGARDSRYPVSPQYANASNSNRASYLRISRSSRVSRQPALRQNVSRSMVDPGYTTLEDVSPYYIRPSRPKKVGVMKNDIITVIVKEQSSIVAESETERRKSGAYDAVIESWVNLVSGLSLKSTPQSGGDPQVTGNFSKQHKAESDLDIRDRVDFRIAALVVDIRPNGNIILEAHRTVMVNNEQWDASLTGIIRPEDVLPDNTVLSEDIAALSIQRMQKGQVRDGIRRGWLTRIIDKVSPF